jgi:small subunit ribosomal protein S19
MSRATKKGPFIEEALYRKVLVASRSTERTAKINTYSRASMILPIMVGMTIHVHNGKSFIPVHIVEEMVGHRLGEFSFTRVMRRHDKLAGRGGDKRKS